MKTCTICNKDITHKKSNRASKCEVCTRRLNERTLIKIQNRTQNMRTVKQEIIMAYKVSCAICGWAINQDEVNGQYLHQKGCEIHHIIPVNEGGKDIFENCILLCPNHHKEADLGIICKDDLLSYVLKDKQGAILSNRLEQLSKVTLLLDDLF